MKNYQFNMPRWIQAEHRPQRGLESVTGSVLARPGTSVPWPTRCTNSHIALFPLEDNSLQGWSDGNGSKNRSRRNRKANGIWPRLPFNTREKTQRQWLENSTFITYSLYFQGSSGSSHLKPTVIFQIPSPWLAPWGKNAAVFFGLSTQTRWFGSKE